MFSRVISLRPDLRTNNAWVRGSNPLCGLRRSHVRPGELRHAEWSEFDFDGEDLQWSSPDEKMHAVPLSKQALEILLQLKSLTGNGLGSSGLQQGADQLGERACPSEPLGLEKVNWTSRATPRQALRASKRPSESYHSARNPSFSAVANFGFSF